MTVEEYQDKLMKLTEEFLGAVRFANNNPFVFRVMLPHQAPAAMKLVIGFARDVDDA